MAGGIPADGASRIVGTRGVVRRTVQVFESFTVQQEWGVRELASHLRIPKSGLHRTLQEMSAEGLVRATENGSYVIGAELLFLASNLIRTADLPRLGYRHILEARNATRESTILVAYDTDRQQIIALDSVDSPQPVQFPAGALREWTDLHLSASGKAMLAFLQPEEIIRYFATDRVGPSGNKVSLRSIQPELAKIREVGWAISHGDRVPGTSGVGAPIFDALVHLVGGVVIIWPDRPQPVGETFIGNECVKAARSISWDLGWRPT